MLMWKENFSLGLVPIRWNWVNLGLKSRGLGGSLQGFYFNFLQLWCWKWYLNMGGLLLQIHIASGTN